MAGKKKVERETPAWIGGIEKSSRQIWLAGLAMYAKAGADGGKAFEALVKDGEKAEKQARAELAQQAEAPLTAGALKPRARGKWEDLEDAFDERLAAAISRLGLAGAEDMAALDAKVDRLARELERLAGAAETSPAPHPSGHKPDH